MIQEDLAAGAKAKNEGIALKKEYEEVFPYFIKVPFTGAYNCGNYYEFEYADNNDYCELEVYNCNNALNYEVESMVALTKLLGKTKTTNYPIYIQQLATFDIESIDTSKTSISKEEARDYIMDIETPIGFHICDWLFDAVVYHGKEKMAKLFNFVEDMGINDLDNRNCGYVKGVPCLVDYSGYYEIF